jgi:hypothetical protein
MGADPTRRTPQQVIAVPRRIVLWAGAAPVAGTSDALQRNCDRPRRTDLTTTRSHRADIDSQFKRCRRNQNFDLAFFQLLFRGEAELARQAAMMRARRFLAQAFAQVVRNALRQPTAY